MSPLIAPASVSFFRSRLPGSAASFPSPRLLLLHVVGRFDEGGAVTGDVGHARGRAALLAVHALGVFAAGHLQAPRRAGEFHRLVGRRRHVLQRRAAATDEVGRTRQHLQARDAARERGEEARVLRPDRMLGPDVRRDRPGHLVAVAVRAHARARIHAQVRVDVDDARRDPLALRIHARRACGRLQARADGDDLAVLQQHVGILQARAGAGEHGRAGDEHRLRLHALVGARIRIVEPARLGGCGGGCVGLRRGACAAGDEDRRDDGNDGLEQHGRSP